MPGTVYAQHFMHRLPPSSLEPHQVGMDRREPAVTGGHLTGRQQSWDSYCSPQFALLTPCPRHHDQGVGEAGSLTVHVSERQKPWQRKMSGASSRATHQRIRIYIRCSGSLLPAGGRCTCVPQSSTSSAGGEAALPRGEEGLLRACGLWPRHHCWTNSDVASVVLSLFPLPWLHLWKHPDFLAASLHMGFLMATSHPPHFSCP